MSRLRCSLIRASRGEKEKKISDTRRKIQFQRANLGYSQGVASLPRMYVSCISASRNSLDFRWPAGSRSHRPSIACISHVFRENMPDKRGPERDFGIGTDKQARVISIMARIHKPHCEGNEDDDDGDVGAEAEMPRAKFLFFFCTVMRKTTLCCVDSPNGKGSGDTRSRSLSRVFHFMSSVSVRPAAGKLRAIARTTLKWGNGDSQFREILREKRNSNDRLAVWGHPCLLPSSSSA